MHSNPTIPSLGTVLGVWAHPDDEAFLSAGLMALARDHGQRVVVVTATAGELGGDPSVRRRELADSLDAVGVSEHRWLTFADGGCDRVPVAMGQEFVAAIIDEVRPDTIVTFGPDGLTGHPDHRAVSAWTTAAWRDAGLPGRLWYTTLVPAFHEAWGDVADRLGFWIDGAEPPSTPPDQLVMGIEASGALLERKVRALRAHTSQTSGMIEAMGDRDFARCWAGESFVAAVGAEVARAA